MANRMAWRIAAAATALCILGGTTGRAQENLPSVDEYADQVQTLAETELLTWIQDPIIISAILEANRMNASMTPAQIEQLDQEWRRQTKIAEKYMIYDLLDRQASIILRDRREQSSGVITEIIVMDKWGLNAAISDPTSDFYQGDEAKYQETYLVGKGAVHVSELELDESTQKVQTQVSMTVVDPDDQDRVIGAVTFGIDLDVLN